MKRTFIDEDTGRLYRLRPNCQVQYMMKDTGIVNGTLVITSTDVVEVVVYRRCTPVVFATLNGKSPDRMNGEELYDIMTKTVTVEGAVQENAWEVFG